MSIVIAEFNVALVAIPKRNTGVVSSAMVVSLEKAVGCIDRNGTRCLETICLDGRCVVWSR